MEKWDSTELFRYSFQIPSRSVLDCYFRRDNTVCHCGKVSNCRVFSGPHCPLSGLNTEIYEPEKTPYLDPFYAVLLIARTK